MGNGAVGMNGRGNLTELGIEELGRTISTSMLQMALGGERSGEHDLGPGGVQRADVELPRVDD